MGKKVILKMSSSVHNQYLMSNKKEGKKQDKNSPREQEMSIA